jgi:tetratricopeptide (TPR) repeat protein
MRANAAQVMAGFGRLELGKKFAREAIKMAPKVHIGHREAALILAMLGEQDKAIEAARQAETLMAGLPDKYSTLDLMEAYGWLGKRQEVARLFEQLREPEGAMSLNHYDKFRAYDALGDTDKALEHLEATLKAHFPAGNFSGIGVGTLHRRHARLWGNPRFEAVIAEMEVEEYYPRPSPPPAMDHSL